VVGYNIYARLCMELGSIGSFFPFEGMIGSLEWGFCLWVEGVFAMLDFHGWGWEMGVVFQFGFRFAVGEWWDVGMILIKHRHNRNPI